MYEPNNKENLYHVSNQQNPTHNMVERAKSKRNLHQRAGRDMIIQTNGEMGANTPLKRDIQF